MTKQKPSQITSSYSTFLKYLFIWIETEKNQGEWGDGDLREGEKTCNATSPLVKISP